MLQKKTRVRIVAALMFATLVGLGIWQVQRLAWKTALLAQIEARMAAPPADLPEKIADPAAWEYRRVILTGRFDPGHVFLIQPRTHNGRNGYHVVVPLRRDGGGTVFVNRGWVGGDIMEKAGAPKGPQRLEGVVQISRPGAFTPENDPAGGTWFWPDIAAMARHAGMDGALPVLVALPPQPAGVYPTGIAPAANIRNDHLQYAIFWFGMAFILVIVYTVSQRQKRSEDDHAGL